MEYAKQNIPVFPCKEKRPLIKGGFKKATTDELQVKEWWEKWPEATIGIETGEKSGIWVVDVDLYKEGVQDLHELFPGYELPKTKIAKTGNGGKHYYFKYNGENIPCSAGKIGYGIDVRGNGGYIIAPPTPGYEWENDVSVVPAPPWLEERAVKKKGTKTENKKEPIKSTVPDDVEKEFDRVLLAPEGERNEKLNITSYLTGIQIAKGEVDEDVARENLKEIAKLRGLEDDEIQNTINSGIEAGKSSIPDIVPIEPIGFDEFINLELPEREMILKPVIPEQGIVEVFGPRGILKTWFVLGIGLAIASGKQAFWTWEAPEPKRVLFIDGEMSVTDLQSRIKMLIKGFGYKPEDDYFNIITPDRIPLSQPVPNIATHQGQRALSGAVGNADVVFLDNLSCLSRYGKENETESWIPVQEWLLNLRRLGKTVVFVHHANKSGGSSGTSARQRICDTVINLKHPKDYKPSQGGRAEVHFDKARGFYGTDAEPFELLLEHTIYGGVKWKAKSTGADEELTKMLELKGKGMSVRNIAEEMGTSPSSVQRRLKAVSQ